jgi:hypothetical protein
MALYLRNKESFDEEPESGDEHGRLSSLTEPKRKHPRRPGVGAFTLTLMSKTLFYINNTLWGFWMQIYIIIFITQGLSVNIFEIICGF